MPGGRYVYNVDLLPRVDLALYPEYTKQVFAPLSEARDGLLNNPELAAARTRVAPHMTAILSPWGILAAGAGQAELDAAAPVMARYAQQVVDLANAGLSAANADSLRARHRALLAAHTDDSVDPRAWQGTTRLAGQEGSELIKKVMRTDAASL